MSNLANFAVMLRVGMSFVSSPSLVINAFELGEGIEL